MTENHLIFFQDSGVKDGIGFSTKMNSERILKGKNLFPRSSVASLYDSILNLYERIFSEISPDNMNPGDDFYSLVREEPTNTMAYMNARLAASFDEYQELALLPFLKKSAGLKQPGIFYEVLENFDFDIYSEAINREKNGGGFVQEVSPMEIYEEGIEEFSCTGGCPSRNSLEGYFTGLYFWSLAEQKNYPTINGYIFVEDFMLHGIYAFCDGRDLCGID